MSRVFKCPACMRMVGLDEIGAAVDLDGPLGWWCQRCRQASPREAWGLSNDGIPASSFFFYEGAGKKEPFMQKLPRALTRNMTFAAQFLSRSRLHVPMPDDPEMRGEADFETVAIYNRAERLTLVGRYYTPPGGGANRVALMLSGSGGTAHQHLSKVVRRYCKRLNMAALLVDYRGFGSSDRKTPSEQGLFTDAQAMFRFLTDGEEMGGLGWAPGKVLIHGYSLGTGVATELAGRQPHAGGVILQCPFTSAADMAAEVGGAPGGWLARHGAEFDVIGKLAGLRQPVLVLIANGDTDMKDHGEAIAKKGLAKVTVAHYDGTHHEPHNAFKDGNKQAYVQEFRASGVAYVPYTGAAAPPPGAVMVKDRNGAVSAANKKPYSTQRGCIADIQNWLGTW